jgi:hypothetical protein
MTSGTTGGNNTAVGGQALYYNQTGSENVAIGRFALGGVGSNSHSSNTAVGSQAAGGITTGNENVFIGASAGHSSISTTTGAGNIYIGRSSHGSAASNTKEIVIAYNSTGKGSNTGFINPNSGGVYQGNNSSSWSTTSDIRIKKNIEDNNIGLEAINQVRVRNFEYRTPDEIDELPTNTAIDKQGVQLGVIAQEIQQVLPDMVKQETTGCLRVDADNITWYLVNAVKELSAKVAELEAKIGD